MESVILAACLVSAVIGMADTPKSRIDPPREVRSDYLPDPSWIPKPSDEASTYSPSGGGLYAARQLLDVMDYAKAIIAGDDHGLDTMQGAGNLIVLKCNTPVLVIQRFVRPFLASSSNVLEVRVLGGVHAKKAVFMLEEHVERLFLRPIVADGSYRPAIGDVVVTIFDDTPLADTGADLDAFESARRDGDRPAMQAMIDQGKVYLAPRFTKGRVENINAVEAKAARKGPRDAGSRLDNAADYTAKQPAGFTVEIKLPSGHTVYSSRRNVGRPVNGPPASTLESSPLSLERVRKVARNAPVPPDQARRDLEAASILEKQGKPDRALEMYRAILRDHPGTPAAAEADARFRAMTGRPAAAKPKG